MDPSDRRRNIALFAAAGVAWLIVVVILDRLDPNADPINAYLGAIAIGAAVGLTFAPLLWLATFARHRRIAYRGDWQRALRRGAWVALVAAVFVVLRVEQIFEPAVMLFVIALVVVAETTLSFER
ncbi:MAG: hypothetical protein L0221_07570 [Chloroflexi bacterium]|nr:hypothetical protein [Chloroflexota bacterium]